MLWNVDQESAKTNYFALQTKTANGGLKGHALTVKEEYI